MLARRHFKVLVVAPLFHGYSASIADLFRINGHQVDLWHYDDHGGLAGRASYKIRNELPSKLFGPHYLDRYRATTTAAAVAVLRQVRPEVVLVIKGDVLHADFWQAAAEQGCLRQLWLYDELRRMYHDSSVFGAVDRLATYSAADAASLKAAGLDPLHVPNGFDSSFLPVRPISSDSILFVGARYPNREEMLCHLSERGVPVVAVGRDWSGHVVDRLRTWSWRRPGVSAMRDVPRDEAYALMAGAAGNLNAHHNQDGFTMRTFEIPGVGGVQLIDRPDVAEYFEPGREVLVYQSLEELRYLSQKVLRDRHWSRRLGEEARSRTLAHHTLANRIKLIESQWD